MTRSTCYFPVIALFAALVLRPSDAADSLPTLQDGNSPQTLDEAWSGYNPTVEPIEAEVCKQWQEDGTVLRAVRYCIGTFKGQKSWMGALYGFPSNGTGLPALVQIHGGGGRASKSACIANARRGYATISLNWRADDRYLKENDLPKSAQTDWGAVEGRQVAESRGIEPNNDKRYDPVPSARNGGYFLRTLAARRALTFLQQQPEVDGDRLGVDGHSMGGVITLETAAMDSRVKAAAPSCAPPIDLEDTLNARTYAASAYVSKIDCPMLFMSPSNDFHGHVEDMEWIMDRMPNQNFRIARSEHFNHKHNDSCLAAKELWFDTHLKNNYQYPARPEITADLKTDDGRPRVRVTPELSQPIDHVDVYFTRDAAHSSYNGSKSRFWQYAKPDSSGGEYVAAIDLFDLSDPLWVFANVHYKLGDHNLTKPSSTMTSTTRMLMIDAKQLQTAGVKADGKTTSVIEDFDDDWQKEWYVSGSAYHSFRLNDRRVPIPKHGKLELTVAGDKAAARVSVADYAMGEYSATVNMANRNADDGVVSIYPFDLKHTKNGSALMSWTDLPQSRLTLPFSRGKLPNYKSLVWQTVPVAEFLAARPFQLGDAPKENGKTKLLLEQADKVVGRFDTDPKTLKVNEDIIKTTYEQGLHVHSPSEVTYFLKGAFSTFESTLVPCYQASVTFEVHGDGKLLFESKNIGGKSQPVNVRVDVAGIQKLKLIVTEGGNGWGGDWVLWANPFLTPRP
ncbi:MAG: NPCBM/NEW2 domain-containing protein [Rubripirellula sp.]